MSGIPADLSLRGLLTPALARVLAAWKQDLATTPCPGEASSLSLRLSRDPQDIAYLYHPSRPARQAAEPRLADLSIGLASRWNAISSPSEILRLADLLADNLADNSGWDGCPAVKAVLGAYLSAHTTAHTLPQGQLLLRPTATALDAWLWAFAHTCPPPPHPAAAPDIPFPHRQAPLAEALHLSPLALLQYTHMRCHQLAQRSPQAFLQFPHATDTTHGLANGLRTPTLTPIAHLVLRALVALVDDLATEAFTAEDRSQHPRPSPPAPQVLSQGFAKGYRLCVAVDRWWRDAALQSQDPATAMLLQGIVHGLAHLLQGWLQAPAPNYL